MPQDYNQTMNLPKTEFPMRAGLPQSEPERLKKWEADRVYDHVMENNEGKPLYVLHDGPPYANGNIHLGTALNKTLKDFIVRYKNMAGFQSPYVPGWDTHGLPTELKARKKAGVDNSSTISDVELRKICREFAEGYIDDQRSQFKRLGGIGEWDNPYITLQKEFEATQIEVFAEMACKGYIYKGLKPVYWCPDCQTALAEAEIEYAEDPCDSIYVKFLVTDDKGLLTQMGADLSKTYFVIWTTTTWTLPANDAICVGPNFTYSLVKWEDEYYVMAEALYESAMKAAGKTTFLEIVGKTEEECLRPVELAAECGFDAVTGTVYYDSILEVIKKHNILYIPFIGERFTLNMSGTIEELTAEARELSRKEGVAGINIAAFRYNGDVEKMVYAVKDAVEKPICCVGSVNSYERLDMIKKFSPWYFTIGSAFFDKKFGETFTEQIVNVQNYLKK